MEIYFCERKIRITINVCLIFFFRYKPHDLWFFKNLNNNWTSFTSFKCLYKLTLKKPIKSIQPNFIDILRFWNIGGNFNIDITTIIDSFNRHYKYISNGDRVFKLKFLYSSQLKINCKIVSLQKPEKKCTSNIQYCFKEKSILKIRSWGKKEYILYLRKIS